METAAFPFRRRTKGLKQAVIQQIAEDYRTSLSAIYHCPPLRSKTFMRDSELSRLITLIERREQVRFQRTSVDLTLTIDRKARNLRRKRQREREKVGKTQRTMGERDTEGFPGVQRSLTSDSAYEKSRPKPEKAPKRLSVRRE